MALTDTTAAQIIMPHVEPGFVDAVYRNNGLLKFFPEPVSVMYDTAFRWKVNSAGNTSSEVFTEGQVQPGASNQSWASAALSWTYVRNMVQITGHARDSLMEQAYVDGVIAEFENGRMDLVDLITTSFMGSTYGLENAVAATGTYAGQTRGAIAWFESSVTAHNDALSLTAIQDMIETISDNDKGGNVGLILAPFNQRTNLWRLSAGSGMKVMDPQDPMKGFRSQTIDGINFEALGDMTDTVILFLDMNPSEWAYVEHRPFQIKPMAPSGDSDVYQLSWAGCLAAKNPKHCGKLTGVTA